MTSKFSSDSRVDVNEVDKEKSCAAAIAADAGHVECIEVLSKNPDTDWNTQDHF